MSVVLVVDDEPDVRLVARASLTLAGHEVMEADSGEKALTRLEKEPVPDIILLDVRMPGIDGWEVLRRLRAHPTLKTLPVVVFTADQTARDEGPDDLEAHEDFLMKPFKPEDLIAAIDAALGGRSIDGDEDGDAAVETFAH